MTLYNPNQIGWFSSIAYCGQFLQQPTLALFELRCNLCSMKAYKRILDSNDDVRKLITVLSNIPCNGKVEVLIRNTSVGKTMNQLGMLFGVWEIIIANFMGEDKDTVHKMLKGMFLERIYIVDPRTPEQEMWVDLRFFYQEKNQQEKLEKHRKRISLAWANLKQMRTFMDDINQYAIGLGIVLPSKDDMKRYTSHMDNTQESLLG